MISVPIFKHEEHHEAFFLWHYAIQKKILKPTNNILLHVDSHSDMGTPLLRTSLYDLPDSLQNIYRFTCDELTIGSFIVPAVFQKIIHQVFWIKPDNTQSTTHKNYVRSKKQQGKFFIVGKDHSPWPNKKPHQDRVCYIQKIVSPNDCIEVENGLILDIDLDYFSCEKFANQKIKLEITEDEYNKIIEDRYHMIKLVYNSLIVKEDDRYFLEINPDLNNDNLYSTKNSEKEIRIKIDEFINFLSNDKINPNMINICRSRLSGCTPKDQWQFIEKELVKKLGKIFKTKIYLIDEILKNCN